MSVVVKPATVFDMAALSGAISRTHWAVAKQMFEQGESWGVHVGDRLVAIAGFYPLEDGTAEAWFCPSSRDDADRGIARAAPHTLAIVRAMRLTTVSAPYLAIVTICRSEAGKRIARLAGFSPVGSCELGEIWAYGRSDGIGGKKADGRPTGNHPEPAAPLAGGDGGRAG